MRSNDIAPVEVKDGEAWEIIKDRNKVEPDIMNNKSARFNLAKNNPLMSIHMFNKLMCYEMTIFNSGREHERKNRHLSLFVILGIIK